MEALTDWGVLVALAVLSASAACSSHCSAFEQPVIKVTNSTNGAPLCDATVVALSDAAQDAGPITLKSRVPPGDNNPADCEYIGLPVGTYKLVASRQNFHDATSSVTIRCVSCDVSGSITAQQITMPLQPI
jgi:hypothetical protein